LFIARSIDNNLRVATLRQVRQPTQLTVATLFGGAGGLV
jgi:hypothetical protein